MMQQFRVIISGGGTGGHIFPAISIANAIKEQHPESEILFVGAKGRMEMQRVPAEGYKIIGLPVEGLIRPLYSLKNIHVLWNFFKSKRMVKSIIRDFKPQVAVGVGGYASAPTLNAAHSLGIPCLIQEQNSYAGVTNKSLAKKAKKICVAYEGMERFFPKEKIILTGNPVRQSLQNNFTSKPEAAQDFGFSPEKKIIVIIGGSLGARTVNESVLSHIDDIRNSDVEILWQTGKYYYNEIMQRLTNENPVPNLHPTEFISNMGNAYAMADLVISRAGASSISELCILGKPCVLVPSPNVAEDHQTKNAMALSSRNAAILLRDADAREKLIPLALTTVTDDTKLNELSTNIKSMELRDSAEIIAEEVYKLAYEKI